MEINNKTLEIANEVLLENKALDFLKGGAKVFKTTEVKTILDKIFKSAFLKKKLKVHPVYLSGQKERVNTYKKDTADYHIFRISKGQQGVAGGRG